MHHQTSKRLTLLAASCAAALVTSTVANAALDPYFPNFIVPSTFGQPSTTYQEWNGFSIPGGPNAPTALANANGSPNALDATAATDGAFLTGVHIYSPQAAIHPLISVPEQGNGAAWNTQLILQVETLGNEIDPATVLAAPSGGVGVSPSSVTLLDQTPLGGFGGFQDDYQFTWNLPGNASGYSLTFSSDSPSLSWAGARVDTVAIRPAPEPGAIGLLLPAAGLLARRRARRAPAAA